MHYPKYLGGMTDKLSIRVKEPYSHFFTSEGRQILESYPDELSAVDIFEISAAYNCSLKPKSVETYVDYVKNINTYEVKVESCKKVCTPYCPKLVDDKVKRLHFFSGSLYYFHPKVPGEETYPDDAEKNCESWFGGHLTSIHSQEEYDFIYSELKKTAFASKHMDEGVIIGGKLVSGEWKWSDGTEMDWPGLVHKWAPNEPNNVDNEENRMDLGDYGQTGGLNDICYKRPSFVCKIPCTTYF